MGSSVGWESLPKDLLDSIIDNLIPVADCVRFSLVCMAWRTAALNNFHRCSSRHQQQLPLLVISNTKDDGEDRQRPFGVIENKFLAFQLPASYDVMGCGSSKGWLIMVETDFKVSLFNPFSDKIIKFPCIERFIYETIFEGSLYRRKCCIIRAELSADPSVSPDQYILMVIYGPKRRLAFIRPNDKEWTYIDSRICTDHEELKWVDDIIHYKSRFHALHRPCRLLGLEIADGSVKVEEITPPDNAPPSWAKPCLVESCEGILLLVLRTENSLLNANFEICKLEDGEGGKSRWVQMRCLGDSTLFLGCNTSICVSGSSFLGCPSNCIYFCADHREFYYYHDGSHEVGLFDVEERRARPRYRSSEPSLTLKSWIWIQPTLL